MADFIKLNEDKFRNLLHDIYSIYSPKHIEKIDTIIEDYGASAVRQMNAIKTAYIIYNRPGHPNYDEDMVGTEKNMIKLMQEYATGERTLSRENLEQQQEQIRKSEEEAKRQEEEAKKKEEEEAKQKSEDQEREREALRMKEEESRRQEEESRRKEIEREKEELKKLSGSQSEEFKRMKEEVEDHKKTVLEYKRLLEEQRKAQMEAEPKISVFENMDIEVMGDVEGVALPDPKFLATLSIGQRIIAPDSGGEGVVGLEVTNMHDDYMSNQERPSRIIEFKRV